MSQIQGSILINGSYSVKETASDPGGWKIASIDWSGNTNPTPYLIWVSKQQDRIFMKPFNSYRKAEYEDIFGASPGTDIDMKKMVEVISGKGFNLTQYRNW